MKAALVALLVLAASAPAIGGSTQETLLDVAAYHRTIGGSLANLTEPEVVIEVLDLTSGARYATDDPLTAPYICRTGDANDVCVPPGGDAFVASEKNRATVAFQPGEWSVGDQVEVVVRFPGNATRGTGTVVLAEGGVRLDVALVTPPDGISLVVLPAKRDLAPDATAAFTVRVTNDRPFEDVFDLSLGGPIPSGWSASLAATSATLAPGASFATTLLIDTPPREHAPYAGGTHNPGWSYATVTAKPQGAPQLAQSRNAVVHVPMSVQLAVDPPTPLGPVDRCVRAAPGASTCFVDPTQRVSLDVVARFVDGSPAAGARIEVDFARTAPLPLALGASRVVATADDAGRARVEMPYALPHVLGGANVPGAYAATARAYLHDLRGANLTTFVVGPVGLG